MAVIDPGAAFMVLEQDPDIIPAIGDFVQDYTMLFKPTLLDHTTAQSLIEATGRIPREHPDQQRA